MSEDIEIRCTVKAKTPRAWLVDSGLETDWVPRSMISNYRCRDNGSDVSSVFIPEWLALEKGFV